MMENSSDTLVKVRRVAKSAIGLPVLAFIIVTL
jgi:hypothetical protein